LSPPWTQTWKPSPTTTHSPVTAVRPIDSRRRRRPNSFVTASGSPSSTSRLLKARRRAWRLRVPSSPASPTWPSRAQLAKDVELFAQHASRKSIRMDDVILTAHRNEHLMGKLRTFSQNLKGKEPCTGKKRKKTSKKDDNLTVI
uniref:Uncharacterized protein n=1 Tax=Aegilops tauschii subsp. strangulata TaxID=200361 RepID=A0A453BW40_AEGTS